MTRHYRWFGRDGVVNEFKLEQLSLNIGVKYAAIQTASVPSRSHLSWRPIHTQTYMTVTALM